MTRFAKILSIVVGMVLVFGVGAALTYNWQQQKIAEANAQKKTAVNELQKAKDDLADAKQSTAKASASSATATSYKSRKGVTIEVYTPQTGASVSSPLVVLGKVPGNWSFEGNFPVRLVDEMGNLIADTQGKLLDEWATDKLVPFQAKLTWTESHQGKLKLILENDNPSGLSQNEDSVSIDLAK